MKPAARPDAGTAGEPVTNQPDGLPAADQQTAAGPGAGDGTVGQAVSDPARNPTADAVTTARRQER